MVLRRHPSLLPLPSHWMTYWQRLSPWMDSCPLLYPMQFHWLLYYLPLCSQGHLNQFPFFPQLHLKYQPDPHQRRQYCLRLHCLPIPLEGCHFPEHPPLLSFQHLWKLLLRLILLPVIQLLPPPYFHFRHLRVTVLFPDHPFQDRQIP